MKILNEQEKNIELSQKDQVMEFVAVGMCFMVLLACALKVVFL